MRKENEAKLLGYFLSHPLAPFNLLADQEFGRETGLGIILSAMKSGKWGTTFAELLFLSVQSRRTCEKYEEAALAFGYDCNHEAIAEHTIKLWLKFKEENPWTVQSPIEPLLIFFGKTTEMGIFSGLQKLKDAGLIMPLCENHVISLTDEFFNRLLAKCRVGGRIAR